MKIGGKMLKPAHIKNITKNSMENNLLPEQGKPANQNILKFKVGSPNEFSQNPEVRGVFDWFNERMKALPEMKVTISPVTDGDKWKAELTSDQQVKEIRGAQFSIQGIDVVSKFSWRQPLLIQAKEKALTENGEVEVSGIVLLMKNTKGETFLTVEQEPGIKAQIVDGKEVHPVTRTPIQTSVTKLRQLTEGQEKVDPTLYSVLQNLAEYARESPVAFINNLSLSKASIDGNRIGSDVLYGVLKLDDQTASKMQEKVPQGRWCSKKEVAALGLMGVANGHLQLGTFINDSQEILGSK
jgi:hypothetical protein